MTIETVPAVEVHTYPPNRWTNTAHRVMPGLMIPVAAAVAGELTGSNLLLWLSVAVTVLGMAGCAALLVAEYRADHLVGEYVDEVPW